jgi:hypothetical protein
MALSMTIGFRGIAVDDAYHRVDCVQVVAKSSLRISVGTYGNRNSEPLVVRDYVSAYDIDGDNPIAQAYLHLKTLPEFAGATDC